MGGFESTEARSGTAFGVAGGAGTGLTTWDEDAGVAAEGTGVDDALVGGVALVEATGTGATAAEAGVAAAVPVFFVVAVVFAAVFFAALVLAVVLDLADAVFFAGVAFASAGSSLAAAVALVDAFLVFAALALALAAVSFGAAVAFPLTASFVACAFFGRVVEIWRILWQRGAAIRDLIGASATAGPAWIQLRPYLDSICVVFNPSRDILLCMILVHAGYLRKSLERSQCRNSEQRGDLLLWLSNKGRSAESVVGERTACVYGRKQESQSHDRLREGETSIPVWDVTSRRFASRCWKLADSSAQWAQRNETRRDLRN